jgi:hypothetical protein
MKLLESNSTFATITLHIAKRRKDSNPFFRIAYRINTLKNWLTEIRIFTVSSSGTRKSGMEGTKFKLIFLTETFWRDVFFSFFENIVNLDL